MFEYGPLPPLMFASMILFMLYGFPVAFSLGAVGLFFGLIGIATDHFAGPSSRPCPAGVQQHSVQRPPAGDPFFTFMGAILERCGLAEDMLEGMGKLFGRVPGGLAYAVIVVGAILGAVTGTVAASVITMGVIALPIMLRYGYNERLATGVIAASGTITQVIPPSLVLVVLADQLGRPVGDMYLGAFGPSLAQILIFMTFILLMSLWRPASMPPLPPEVRGEASLMLVLQVLAVDRALGVLIFCWLGNDLHGVWPRRPSPARWASCGALMLVAPQAGGLTLAAGRAGHGPDHRPR
jgi:TRAP-type mannitol/chloroaromatic compound transport system permease large subunit